MVRRNEVLVIALLIALTLSACGGKPAADVQAIETQVAAKIFATQTASVPAKTPTPPHAPTIVRENNDGTLYGENVMVVQVPAGKRVTLKVMDLWKAPETTPVPSCAEAYLKFTWIVRKPYPDGREDLGFETFIPMGGGRTQVIASGATGSSTAGWCDELTLFNGSLEDYWVELRYAAGHVDF
jgi:hypothetical protein